jgi:hypothetical protein
LNQTGIITLRQEVETEAGHVVEPFVSLHAGQAKRRPAFECQEITRAAKQLCNHLIRFALRCLI